MSITAESSNNRTRLAAAKRRRRRISFDVVAHVAALMDIVLILASTVTAVTLYHHLMFGITGDPSMNFGVGMLTAVIFVLAMATMQAYSYDSMSSMRRQIVLILFLFPTVLAFVLAIVFFLKLGDSFSRGAILYLTLLSMVTLVGIRIATFRWIAPVLANTMLRPRKAFLICPRDLPEDRVHQLLDAGSAQIASLAQLPEGEIPTGPFLDRLSGLDTRSGIDEIIVVWRDGNPKQLEELLIAIGKLPLPAKIVFDNLIGSVASCPRAKFGTLSAFQVQSAPLAPAERLVKRVFDITVASIALILLSPMLLMVAIAIKIDTAGPVFFRQKRLGHDNQPFRIVKFRSMSVMEDGDAVRQATVADARITRVGAFIRAYSIDELPQFWNVLRGEMSVVGPRPHAVAHDNLFDPLISEYASRRHVKPGVTGWAQVCGHRGETPTIELMAKRVQHDRWYIDNWSLWLDIRIVLQTFISLRGH